MKQILQALQCLKGRQGALSAFNHRLYRDYRLRSIMFGVAYGAKVKPEELKNALENALLLRKLDYFELFLEYEGVFLPYFRLYPNKPELWIRKPKSYVY